VKDKKLCLCKRLRLFIQKRWRFRLMNEVLFIIFRFVLLVALFVLMKYIIPYLQKLVDDSELRYLRQVVSDAVLAAEQTISATSAGIEKKGIVTEFIKNMLISKNISISDQQIDNLIESAVYLFNASNKTKGEESNE
jgi:hypothetical protein